MSFLFKHVKSNSCVVKLIFFVLFFMCPLLVSETVKAAQSAPGVTVFIYHRFGEDRYPTTNVSEEQFREQMAYLLMNNYQVMALQDMVHAIQNQTPLPEKAAVITIDDGYRSVYNVAWPILKSFNFPFTVFLYVEGVDKGFNGYLSWEQVREMQQDGVDFQDHSYFHHHLGNRPQGFDEAAYRSWIREDFRKSSDILAKNLGYRPSILATPYGEYNSIIQQEARSFGYEAICSQDAGSISAETDLNSIPREPILGNEWSTVAHFEKVLNRIDMPVTVMDPAPDPLQSNMINRFGAGLLYPERYEKGSMGVFVSGLGWHRAEMDGNFIYFDNDKPLQRYINRVTVSGKDKESGRLALRTWMVINPEKQPD